MPGPTLRLTTLLGAGAATSLLALTAAATASATAVPTCPAGTEPGLNPPKACLHTSWATDTYVAQVGGQEISVSQRAGGPAKYSWVQVTVKASFTVDLNECPAGGSIPYADIPCQMGSANITMIGRYLPGHGRLAGLDDVDSENPYDVPLCTANATSGTCSYTFRLPKSDYFGLNTFVMQVGDGQISENPANDLGDSGYEFGIDVKMPPKPKPR